MAKPPKRAGQPVDRVVLSDPRAIRALAHPARLAILEVLQRGEELTATECSAIAGLSPSATSYHLKALEQWGLVTRAADRPDGRDRPWKAVGRSVVLDSSTGAAGVAEAAVVDAFLERTRAHAAEFLSAEDREPRSWRDAVEMASGEYWLTSNELRKLSKAFHDILEEYKPRTPQQRPDGSRRVRVTRILIPSPDDDDRPAGPASTRRAR
jgi:DNA-binding transcriptional ArsR family regulator